MKKNDIAAIILIACASFIIAWFAANSFLPKPTKDSQKVKTAELISSDLAPPGESPINKKIFSRDAINPTVERTIGKSASSLPFNQGE